MNSNHTAIYLLFWKHFWQYSRLNGSPTFASRDMSSLNTSHMVFLFIFPITFVHLKNIARKSIIPFWANCFYRNFMIEFRYFLVKYFWNICFVFRLADQRKPLHIIQKPVHFLCLFVLFPSTFWDRKIRIRLLVHFLHFWYDIAWHLAEVSDRDYLLSAQCQTYRCHVS